MNATAGVVIMPILIGCKWFWPKCVWSEGYQITNQKKKYLYIFFYFFYFSLSIWKSTSFLVHWHWLWLLLFFNCIFHFCPIKIVSRVKLLQCDLFCTVCSIIFCCDPTQNFKVCCCCEPLNTYWKLSWAMSADLSFSFLFVFRPLLVFAPLLLSVLTS